MDVEYHDLENSYDVVRNLVKTPLKVSCDVFMHEESSSLDCKSVFPSPLDHSHVSPMCSPPSYSVGIILKCSVIVP